MFIFSITIRFPQLKKIPESLSVDNRPIPLSPFRPTTTSIYPPSFIITFWLLLYTGKI